MGKTITIEKKRYKQLLRNEDRLLKIKSYVSLITKIVNNYDKGNKSRRKPA
jgi:hypothetical protein